MCAKLLSNSISKILQRQPIFLRPSPGPSRHFRKLHKGDGGQQVAGTSLFSYSMLSKPLVFTVGFSSCAFAGALIWQHESLLARKRAFFSGTGGGIFHQYRHKRGELRHKLNTWWERLPEGHKVSCGIILVNCLVFLAWRFTPHLKLSMVQYFTCKPTQRGVPCWPMLLSSFSHYSALHLATNMYVLWSFSPAMVGHLGKEEFIALYLAAGVFSSFTSNIYKIATSTIAPSLGASGSIMAIIGAMCTTFPDAQLAIVFLPMFAFTAAQALKGIILFDAAGMVFRWGLFDHAAHLGGMAFGLWYVHYGRQLLWRNRERVVRRWELLKQGKL